MRRFAGLRGQRSPGLAKAIFYPPKRLRSRARPTNGSDRRSLRSDDLTLFVIGELQPLRRPTGPGRWWIATEISLLYEAHQCPSHDLVGWRRERLPERPSGIVNAPAASSSLRRTRSARSSPPATSARTP